ncbi:hypothetical protein EKO27_g4768 [Xylaria grammica]|uniref:J domain-containing protein n=1 Tax=Xylaria grammica TaxID=363999 RepID=A0A439D7F5_9PEZI|nr:hypothetical protein EKO27_g4768 [Xylaria grammica]
MDLAQSREPFVVSDSSSHEGNAPEAINAGTGPRAQRTRVNHILKLQQRNATLYELLDVQVDATNADIIHAWKKIVGGIHPDKNKDSAAQRCTQAVNNAKDVLTDPRRRATYDNFRLINPPPPTTDTFDEEFAQGAFDGTDSDDDALEQDDKDSEGDVEASYPPPTKQITQLHRQITPHIEELFRDIDSISNTLLLSKIEQINNKIRKVTKRNKKSIPPMYEVPREKLITLQYTQRSILMGFETQQSSIEKVQREILGLRNYFTRTCQRGLYHWPIDWVQHLMEPLHRKLETLGVPREQQMLPRTDNRAALPAGNDGDIEMEDIEDFDEDIDGVDEGIKGTHFRQKTRALLRPGFTIYGDPILGYIPNITNGRLYPGSSRMFVRVDSINPIKLETGITVGVDATIAYDNLPGDRKNNIREMTATYSTMCSSRFYDIVGVAKEPRSKNSNSTRPPPTYIWVEVRPHSDKPIILTKTVFRTWQGSKAADRYIDDWLETRGLNPDPRDPEYLELIHSPAENSGTHRPHERQLKSSRDDGGIEELNQKFGRIADMLAKAQEEAREDRALTRDLLKRFLHSP